MYDEIHKFTVTLYIALPLNSNIFHLKLILDHQKNLFMDNYNELIKQLEDEIGRGMSQFVAYHR